VEEFYEKRGKGSSSQIVEARIGQSVTNTKLICSREKLLICGNTVNRSIQIIESFPFVCFFMILLRIFFSPFWQIKYCMRLSPYFLDFQCVKHCLAVASALDQLPSTTPSASAKMDCFPLVLGRRPRQQQPTAPLTKDNPGTGTAAASSQSTLASARDDCTARSAAGVQNDSSDVENAEPSPRKVELPPGFVQVDGVGWASQVSH
jgi:hypothetical protein